MFPQQYLKKIASAVSKRSGICQATVEQVLPAFIDEVRFQLTEGKLSVPIDSFGTFALIDIPERQHLYTYKGANELRTLPPKERSAITLFYLSGYSIKEVAVITETSEDAVKKQLSRGRDKLRQELKMDD